MTAPNRRWAVLVGTALAFVILVRCGSWAVAELGALSERVETRRGLLAAIEAERLNLVPLQQVRARLRDTLTTLAPRLLRGTSEIAALADLSGRLGTIASRYHGRLVRLDAVPDSLVAGRLQRVRARALIETDFEGVAEMLAGLERQEVVLVPERMVIMAPEPSAGPETPERLEVELQLTGWFLPGVES